MNLETTEIECTAEELVFAIALDMVLEKITETFKPAPQYLRETPKIGRNDFCPCGSKQKFKKCCGK